MAAPTNTLDSTLSAINSITQKYYVPKLADEVNTSNALLTYLQKNGQFDTIDGGSDIRVPIRYARFTARGWYSGTETLDTSYNEKKFSLIFPWAQYHVSPTISGLDQIKNAGAAKVLDHVDTELAAAKEDIRDAMGTGLYSAGTDSKSIIGARVFLSASNTYGGISQSANAFMQAKVDTLTTVTSLSAMQARWEAASEPPDRPNFITMTETLYNAFWSLLQPQQRFQDGDQAKAGFQNILFNGAPAMEDSYAPTSFMVFWNLKYLTVYSSTQRNFPGEFVPWAKPTNQDAMVSHFYWAGQLCCSQPRKQGAFTGLTS